MPGDAIDVAKSDFCYKVTERITEETFEPYLKAYAAKYDGYFSQRRLKRAPEEITSILQSLQHELEQRMRNFDLSHRIKRCLYIQFSDAPEHVVCVDFQRRGVAPTVRDDERDFYLVSAPSWEIERVLSRKITWEDFSLTFRMRLSRKPDVYQTLIHGFMTMESEDLNHFCEKLLEIETRGERWIVEAGGCHYSVNRYCPHQGADLSEGWVEDGRYLVCARHRWRFDLRNEGRCATSDNSINAIALEEN
jgi:UDP-MurNAc hydroxylase